MFNHMEIKVLFEMMNYFKNDIRRINHSLKVYSYAKVIGGKEELKENEMHILLTASILHDIGIKESERKYNSSSGKLQEQEGPKIAKKMLKVLDFKDDFIDRVNFLIGNHHSYNKIDCVDFQILIEADFIVNIFEEDMSLKTISNIKNKYFKTKTGIHILENMFKI